MKKTQKKSSTKKAAPKRKPISARKIRHAVKKVAKTAKPAAKPRLSASEIFEQLKAQGVVPANARLVGAGPVGDGMGAMLVRVPHEDQGRPELPREQLHAGEQKVEPQKPALEVNNARLRDMNEMLVFHNEQLVRLANRLGIETGIDLSPSQSVNTAASTSSGLPALPDQSYLLDAYRNRLEVLGQIVHALSSQLV